MISLSLEGLKAIAGWMGSLGTWQHSLATEKKAETKAALESLMNAVIETRAYLVRLRDNPSNRDVAEQGRLSQLWAKAGTDMAAIDSDIAYRYVLKADYWSDPEGWDERNGNPVLIELDEVFRLGREALLPTQ